MFKTIPYAPAIVALVLVLNVATASPASAHEWTLKLNGKQTKVEAKVIDFDGQKVLLESDNGAQKAFEISDLNEDDMAHLKNILVARQTVTQRQMAMKQLQQQQTEIMQHHNDLWEVVLYARNGSYGYRQYFARSNLEAQYYARRDYPYARIGAARKIRHRGF